MIRYFSVFLFLLFSIKSFSQTINNNTIVELTKKEDSLKTIGTKILQDEFTSERVKADSAFTKLFVRALKLKNSFYFPFDSVISISKLYAPDSSFRIFTWQVMINEQEFVYHGAIQMNTKDGALQLFPLVDKSNLIENYDDTVSNNKSWIGCLYYKVLMNSFNNKKFYTFLGYDENNDTTSKKLIEVMRFEKGEPIFGGNYFAFPKNDTSNKPHARFVMEFKKFAGPKLNFDEEFNMIIKEQLVSETNEPFRKSTLIGVGDYDGFSWKNGKWIFEKQVFDQKNNSNPAIEKNQ